MSSPLTKEFKEAYFIVMIAFIAFGMMFLGISLVYTLMNKSQGIVSSLTSRQQSFKSGVQRQSIVPQTMLYEAIVRLSVGSAPAKPTAPSS